MAVSYTHLDVYKRQQLAFMPLRMGMRVVGCVGVSGSVLSRQTLEAIGSLVAISIERAGAVEKLSRAEAARESEQLRSVLLDSVTHEFRSPLTAIKASVTSLLGSPNHSPERHSPEEKQELLTIIDEESDRLNRLIGEAAEMAQLDANKVEFRFTFAPIGPVVANVLDELKQTLVHHPVEVKIPPDFPNARMDSVHILSLIHISGNVPAEAGTIFFFARLPAIASMGMIMKKRPTSMVIAPAVLYQSVLPFNPPNAEPLLPAMDVNA